MTPQQRAEIVALHKRLSSINPAPTDKDAHDAALVIESFLNDHDATMPLLRKTIKMIDSWNDPRQENPFEHPLTALANRARPAIGDG